jgi:hypothetical protein
MDPLDDNELNQLLHQWRAPDAPASLTRKVIPRQTPMRQLFVTFRVIVGWLLTGSIRVPVPVGLGLVIVLALFFYFRKPAQPSVAPAFRVVSIADFQPVTRLEPRIIQKRAAEEGK